MEDKRKYHIIIGSKGYFDMNLPEFTEDDVVDDFLELVKISDTAKQNRLMLDQHADILTIKNNSYHGIVEAAHDRLGPLIEELTTDDAEIYIHNPPSVLKEYLENQKERSLIELDIVSEKYEIKRDSDVFVNKIKEISLHIFGQQTAIEEISKSLWYLTTVKRSKPYVIMLYGNSSLGKTELVRESNLIFFDELDKCPEHFFSAFCTLFDNVQFRDATYDVDVSGTVIILTSNYHTKEEMQKQLGLPIFYRIDKAIHFDDFSCETIYKIVQNEILERKDEYIDKLTPDMVYAAVSPLILTSGENARTIKYKVQQVIEELLFQEIHEKMKCK